jgi:hypothetical protein
MILSHYFHSHILSYKTSNDPKSIIAYKFELKDKLNFYHNEMALNVKMLFDYPILNFIIFLLFFHHKFLLTIYRRERILIKKIDNEFYYQILHQETLADF